MTPFNYTGLLHALVGAGAVALHTASGSSTAVGVHKAVYAEFVRWFVADTAGSLEHYERIASETWLEAKLLSRHFRKAEEPAAGGWCHKRV